MRELKMDELRAALEDLGQDKSGRTKVTLVDRLLHFSARSRVSGVGPAARAAATQAAYNLSEEEAKQDVRAAALHEEVVQLRCARSDSNSRLSLVERI